MTMMSPSQSLYIPLPVLVLIQASTAAVPGSNPSLQQYEESTCSSLSFPQDLTIPTFFNGTLLFAPPVYWLDFFKPSFAFGRR